MNAKPNWNPPPRPDWVQQVNSEAKYQNLSTLIPLDVDELLDTAQRVTGLTDFGPSDGWEDGLRAFVSSINEEANLHLMGRIIVRGELLRHLDARLRVEAAYTANPEIADEKIVAPLVITGLGRTGTTILHEVLMQDERNVAPLSWEYMFPTPPPEAGTYRTDLRIAACEHIITQTIRVAPTFGAAHERGALVPQECTYAMQLSFSSDVLGTCAFVPSYNAWLKQRDMRPVYEHHKRVLKLLQFRNPRERWLLKSINHFDNLPLLFELYPDAEVVISHRDPVKALASGISMVGTIMWIRSDKLMEPSMFGHYLEPAPQVARLNRFMDQLDGGVIPAGQVHNLIYKDLVRDPAGTLRKLYEEIGIPLSDLPLQRMVDFLASKPKEAKGVHVHAEIDDADIQRHRDLLERYETRFQVPRG